jgi:hypothetical protein
MPPRRSREGGESAGAPPREGGGRPPRGERRGGRFNRGDRGDRGRRPEAPFQPILEADFYPDDAPFKALTQAIKNSCRTFELFEIAQLILEKPERWICVAKHPKQKDGEPALLHACVQDGLPFLSEQAAIDHAFKHYAGEFFTVEEYEGEAPAGTFPMIHKCGMTGELLAPPNYHRYQAILREHHASRLSHVSYERFEQKLEAVREPEAISAWQEKMKKRVRFTLKPEFTQGEEPKVLETREDARIYLVTHLRDKLVRPAYSVRFVGKDVSLLPENDLLRRSIEALYEQQKRFPLNTANNLRGRLRRLNFAVYKKGTKGVSFVCAVKRHFRTPSEVLSENLADLIAFIEAHPNIKAPELPKQYLGMSDPSEATEKAKAEETTAVEASADVSAETPAEPTEAADASESAEAAPAEAAKPSADEEQFIALRRDLRYLVSQGYVIEYSDGRLFVPPMRDASGQIIGEANAPDDKPVAKRDKSKPAKEKKKPEAAAPSAEKSVEPTTEPVAEVAAEPAPAEEAPSAETPSTPAEAPAAAPEKAEADKVKAAEAESAPEAPAEESEEAKEAEPSVAEAEKDAAEAPAPEPESSPETETDEEPKKD